MPELKLGSLFDGISGFPLAASRHGITPVWASEIEPACISIARRHFPDVIHLGDITKINGTEIEPVDIVTFGSPCQDLSVAGKRAGLAGARSGLFGEAIRIIEEMRESTNGAHPTWAIWENVPGALSSNDGLDFRAVLRSFANTEGAGSGIAGAIYPGVAKTLIARGDSSPCADRGINIIVAAGFDLQQITSKANRSTVVFDSPQPTLCKDGRPHVIAVHQNQSGEIRAGVVANTLNTNGNATGRNAPIICMATGQAGAEICANLSPTLNCNHEQPYISIPPHTVRRLTPVECERLQGFPDGWTEYGYDGKQISDSKRYAAIGNSVAVPCVDYLMAAIAEIEGG